jgi:sulfate adenylyltransferase subunit 1
LRDFRAFAGQIGSPPDLQFIPVSALCGDNVVTRSTRMPWYGGPALLEYLETVPIAPENHAVGLRLPVQYVIRPNQDFRGLAGQLASGAIRPGDRVVVLPSGRETRVRSIVTREGELAEAFAPMSVTVCLDEEVDVSRGDMLVSPADPPARALRFEATLVWMNEKPAVLERPFLAEAHHANAARAHRRDKASRGHPHSGGAAGGRTAAQRNRRGDRGSAAADLRRCPYRRNRFTGSFILLDALTNETVGAGMIESAVAEKFDAAPRSAAIHIESNPDVLWLLARRLVENGHRVAVVSSELLQIGPAGALPVVELSFNASTLADNSGGQWIKSSRN